MSLADIGEMHFDLGNDIFEKMLGPSMADSCGEWKENESLTEAQYAKFDLIGRKLQLSRGRRSTSSRAATTRT